MLQARLKNGKCSHERSVRIFLLDMNLTDVASCIGNSTIGVVYVLSDIRLLSPWPIELAVWSNLSEVVYGQPLTYLLILYLPKDPNNVHCSGTITGDCGDLEWRSQLLLHPCWRARTEA